MSNRNTCPPRRFKDFPQFDFETTISTFPTPGCERLPRRRVARGHVKTATMRRDSDGHQRVVRLRGEVHVCDFKCVANQLTPGAVADPSTGADVLQAATGHVAARRPVRRGLRDRGLAETPAQRS